ncbi:hypothetical protein [Kribbella solani]|uniref:Uncharacterized protein n=1 Tax=Kribbella solani TaxID=236067 RepID=A0A841DZT3_9ACTN|nr:hypothetical protein [Kribbella solani]MBB5982275.1 hypothetical protein [Kribbella solani]MDX2968491.1 hypothetical protein [Kribbella solani]MDX3003850.1 hypothetical protein [Kribbella solani]
MFSRIALIALTGVSISGLAVVPAAAAERQFEIPDPAGTSSHFNGSITSSRTSATVKARMEADRAKMTAWICVSSSRSGCNLVGNQKKLWENDARPRYNVRKEMTRTYSLASGQSVWARACFVQSGAGSCSGWK